MRLLLVAALALLGATRVMAQEVERWQVTLNDGRIIWELQLVRMRGDTLVARHADSTYRFPLSQLDELRLVVKAERHQTPEPDRYGGVLNGADDEIYRLTLYSVPERRDILAKIFKDHPPPSPGSR
jgi:hypothetical protein